MLSKVRKDHHILSHDFIYILPHEARWPLASGHMNLSHVVDIAVTRLKF